MHDVTIVIPAYNAEHFISRSIQSVLAQKYSDWELIIINDGSTDQTQKIVEKFVQLDSRIKLINQNNQGVSAARNRGITESQGFFISFLDADDIYHVDYIELMVSALQSENADMAFCKYCEVDGDKILRESPSDINTLYDGNFIAHLLHVKNATHSMATMYRLSMIRSNHILFDTCYCYGEDLEFVLLGAYFSSKIIFVPKVLYTYFYTLGSLSRRQIPYLDLLGELDSLYRLYALFESKNEDQQSIYQSYFQRRVQGVLNNIRRYYWSLLRSRKFEELELLLQEYQDKYGKDLKPEYHGIKRLTDGMKVKIIMSRSKFLWSIFAK